MKLVENVDYYIDEQSGLMILTASFLKKRGKCCGSKCKNCCYIPKFTKGSTQIDEEKK